jgi:hypothetical protein
MKLRSFGCSLIYGSELSDEHGSLTGLAYTHYSRLTWPALLAQKLNYLYRCHARPGSGNLQIAERVLSQLAADNEIAFYVIGWSFIDRFDYVDKEQPINNNGASLWYIDNNPGLPWATVRPDNNKECGKIYYRDLHSETRDKLTTLMSIKLIIDTLQQKNYPFIMTYEDGLIFDQQWHTSPAIIALQEYVKPYMTTFDGGTFVDFAKKNRYPITPMGHPLDEAHAAASELMIKVFDTQNTNDR